MSQNGRHGRPPFHKGGGGNRGAGHTNDAEITAFAPYNFVPLSEDVWLPSWGSLVSHDAPFKDGWCGEIKVEIRARTDMLVGGNRKRPPQGPTSVDFFVDADGKPSIPGSSMKGLIRSTLEILSFSRFSWVDDRRLGVRDLTPGGEFYRSKIAKTEWINNKKAFKARARAGFLRFENRKWNIVPCEYGRVEHSVLDQIGLWDPSKGRNENFRTKQNSLESQGRSVFVDPTVDELVYESRGRFFCYRLFDTLARTQNAGSVPGTVVLTGQIRNKHREFIFYDGPQGFAAKPKPVPEAAIKGFLEVHKQYENDADSPWGYWRERLLKKRDIGPGSVNEAALPGIPVFYLEADEQIDKLGLAQMFKMAYDHTIHDMVGHTSPAHIAGDGDGFDLAELMFGTVRKDGGRSLKGRVSFGLGSVTAQPGARRSPGNIVLSSPKPSYYPFYVDQSGVVPDRVRGDRVPERNGVGTYKTYMADKAGSTDPKLRGWKRYLPRDIPAPVAAANNQLPVASELRPMPDGTTFACTIGLHNLRTVEIGALVAALTACSAIGPGKAPLRGSHLLGMGKPYGYGRVEITITAARLEPNDLGGRQRGEAVLEGDAALDRLRGAAHDFRSEIDGFLTRGGKPSFDARPQIEALRMLSDPKAVQDLAKPEPYVRLVMNPQNNPFVLIKGRRQDERRSYLPARALPKIPKP